MFEEEADEATLDLYGSADDVYGKEDYKQGFKDGADLGYNKANEWYYPSKGKYPDNEALYLIQWQDGTITADTIYVDGNGEPYLAGSVTFDDVIAWKEIVLPELPRESE